MSYPGSFFQDDTSDSTVKAGETSTSRRRTTARARQAAAAHPTNSTMDLRQQQQQQQIINQMQAQILCNSNVLQTNDDQGQVQTAPRGSRLEIKRVDEVYDASRQTFVVQEGYKSPEMDEKNEPFAEYAFLVWRRIVPPPSPAIPPTTHTSIDVKSDYLKDLCQNIIGGFMGISWMSKPLRVRSLQRALCRRN